MKDNMRKENQKRKGVEPDFTEEQIKKLDGSLEQQWEKDRSYDDELIIVEEGKGFLDDDELKELGITREELDSYEDDDDETDTLPISLAERMGSEKAPGLVFETFLMRAA